MGVAMTATLDLAHEPLTLAAMLKVLADPNRLRIFNLLMEGVQCI